MPGLQSFFQRGMNFRHIRLLVAIDEHKSIRRVAAHLNVTQPAVSKALAQIEEGLGAELFLRKNRSMEATPLGACLIRHARDILMKLKETENELMDLSQCRSDRIALGVLPAATLLLVPKFISRVESMSSSIIIKVTENTSEILLSHLRAGDLDFAISLISDTPLPAEYEKELLFEDPILLAVRPGHPLLNRDRVAWEDVAKFPMNLPPSTASSRHAIDAIMAALTVSPSARRLETVSTMATVGTLQYTDSIGFLSQSLVKHFSAYGVVSPLPIKLENVALRMGLIWMKDRRETASHQLTRTLLRETCQEIEEHYQI